MIKIWKKKLYHSKTVNINNDFTKQTKNGKKYGWMLKCNVSNFVSEYDECFFKGSDELQ